MSQHKHRAQNTYHRENITLGPFKLSKKTYSYRTRRLGPTDLPWVLPLWLYNISIFLAVQYARIWLATKLSMGKCNIFGGFQIWWKLRANCKCHLAVFRLRNIAGARYRSYPKEIFYYIFSTVVLIFSHICIRVQIS